MHDREVEHKTRRKARSGTHGARAGGAPPRGAPRRGLRSTLRAGAGVRCSATGRALTESLPHPGEQAGTGSRPRSPRGPGTAPLWTGGRSGRPPPPRAAAPVGRGRRSWLRTTPYRDARSGARAPQGVDRGGDIGQERRRGEAVFAAALPSPIARQLRIASSAEKSSSTPWPARSGAMATPPMISVGCAR